MPTKEKQNKLQKKFTSASVREVLFSVFPTLSRLNKNLDDLGVLLQRTENKKDNERFDELRQKHKEIFRACETETHIALIESFNKEFRDFAIEMTDQTIREYGCKTAVEKALAEIITGGFIRFIDNSQRLNAVLEDKSITSLKNSHISILSKQADRAQRQFIGAIIALKQLKAPLVEMSIKTTNAFLSQNQQINVEKKNNGDK